MPVERVSELHDALILRRNGTKHRWYPAVGMLHSCRLACLLRDVARKIDAVMGRNVLQRTPAADAEHDLDLVAQPVSTWTISLVHREDVGNLHQPRLQSLNGIPRLRHEHDYARIRGSRNIKFALSHANGLDEDAIHPECVEHVTDFPGCSRQATQ